jgi:hypothetical protein
MRLDWKRLSTLDRAIAGGAAVAFVAAFLPWWGLSVQPFGLSVDGWSAGFTAWAGTLLLTAAGVLLMLRHSGTTLNVGNVGPSLLIACVAALGLLLVVIRWASLPRYRGIDVGARYGIYIALIAGIVEVTAAVLALRAAGEPTPWTQPPQAAEQPESDPGPPAPED